MKILISAGHHDNPVHRYKLRGWLTVQDQKRGTPKFIAVEANRALFQSAIQFQRDAFIKNAKVDDILKGIDLKYLKELSLAISYEADTHSEVFPDFHQILWLDNVRPDFNTISDPCCMAQRYLELCRSAVIESKLEIIPSLRRHKLFEAVDNYITHKPEIKDYKISPSTTTFERDKAWMELLDPLLTKGESTDYGIAVVGENHSKDEPHYLRHLLSASGHECEVEILSN